MENHGTESNLVKDLKSQLANTQEKAAAKFNDYHMRVEALHAALAIQPKDKPEGQQNPSVGQLVADAEKILTYLKGE